MVKVLSYKWFMKIGEVRLEVTLDFFIFCYIGVYYLRE